MTARGMLREGNSPRAGSTGIAWLNMLKFSELSASMPPITNFPATGISKEWSLNFPLISSPRSEVQLSSL